MNRYSVSVTRYLLFLRPDAEKFGVMDKNSYPVKEGGGVWWRNWLRNCATNRKVAGSIHDGVIAIWT